MKEEDIELKIQQLIEAAENRRAAEVERISAEQCRIQTEAARLALEQQNARLLANISTDIKLVVASVSRYGSDDHKQMLTILNSILSLVQVIAVRVGGGEVDEILDLIRSNSMKVQVGDHATIHGIVEGTQTNINSPITTIEKMIDSGDEKGVEAELNSLPADIVDVAVAALAGPLAAAKMIATKVAGKWKVSTQK